MKSIGRYVVLWCTVVSIGLIIYSNGGNYMSIAEWIAIGIALAGVAGGIWAQIIQFKKDAQRIDGVNKTSGEVKNDTVFMKPLVKKTDANVQELRDSFLKRENQIDATMKDIGKLVAAKEIDDAIKQRISSTVDNPEYIKNAVSLVYEKNAALSSKVAELNNEKIQLSAHIQALKNENGKLKQKNHKLINEVNQLQSQLRSYDEPEMDR